MGVPWGGLAFRRLGWRRGAPLYFYLCHSREGERGTDTDANSFFHNFARLFRGRLANLQIDPN